ncbi:MAG: AMP-binding protein [Pseudomonadota bacterium]
MTDTPSRTKSAPLTTRPADQHIAFHDGRRITVAQFCGQVQALAAALPDQPYAVNLCRDRYPLLVSMCAVMLRGQCNLLPSSRQPSTVREVADRYSPAYVVHDAEIDTAGLGAFRIPASALEPGEPAPAPEIPLDQLGAISFTSGSTGQSGANLKPWRTLFDSTAVNIRYMLGGAAGPHELLATVPGQHMYGLETSILAPLQGDICLHTGQPLFPDDVRAALERMTAPRVLVSTPLHLRALLGSELAFPPVQFVLSATAPLGQELAAAVETRFGASVREIYGCSEAGSLAWRHTAHTQDWEAFDAFDFRSKGEECTVYADHLPEPVPLQDVLAFSGPRHFTLKGRLSDLVNVAGKRGSLAALTELLQDVPGVIDGVVFQPPHENGIGRLAAMVVAPTVSAKTIAQTFRERVDAALVPRPIVFTDALPRSETGKLPRDKLLAAWRAHRSRS